MKFRNWIEAQNWLERLPKKPLDYNSSQVNAFVDAMANKGRNAVALYSTINRIAYNDTRYNKPIANNLLVFNDVRLKNAIGEIHNNIEKSEFKFFPDGEQAGSILIRHPPVVYDNIDKTLLTGVIVHELQHAADWLKYKNFKPTRFNSFNSEKYVRHWTEARAYSQQLVEILRRIPNKKAIIDALSGHSSTEMFKYGGKEMPYPKHAIFSWSPLLLDYAKEFLDHYQGRNEGVLSNIAAPLVMGAASLMPSNQPQPPVNAMQQQVMSQTQEAANLLTQIVQKMLFRNFLIRA